MPGTGSKPPDSRLVRWKRILRLLQEQPGAESGNNPKLGDTIHRTMEKVLASVVGYADGNGCGVPSNTVQIIGAGFSDADGFYTKQANGSWLQNGPNGNTITFGGGIWTLTGQLANAYQTPINAFPCTWVDVATNIGQSPPPTGKYV